MLLKIIHRLKQEQKPFKFLLSRFFWLSRLCRFYLIKVRGVKLFFFPSALSATLWVYPDDRNEDLNVLDSILKPGNTVVDIGANIGLISLYAAKLVGSSGKVYSIEPHPKIFSYLEKNIQLNNSTIIKLNNVCLGETNGMVSFSDGKSDDQNQVQLDSNGLQVPMIRLDEFDISETRINLLKIDVEGYELNVFKGAIETLKKVQAIYLEVNVNINSESFGYTAVELFSFLGQQGFELYKYNEGDLSEYDAGSLITQTFDLVALKSER